jgi:hypothetical protein
MSSIVAARRFSPERLPRQVASTLIAAGVIAVPLAALFWLSGAVSLPAAFAATTLVAFVVMCAGFQLLRAARAADMTAPAAWVLGVAASALALYALVAGFGMLASTAFALWTLGVLGVSVLTARRVPTPPRIVGNELAALALCGLATAFWCHELAAVPQGLAAEGTLRTWTDQFIHGSAISQLGDMRSAGHQHIELADFPPPLYHYASYVLPAVLAQPLDLPGLPLATSLWAPLGFFTACAGAYALGASLAGRTGGVAALAVLTLLPDAASYGLHNRLFGYYWYVVAVPSAAYAVGVGLLSTAFLARWMSSRDPRALAAGAGLIGAMLLVRVHIFALAAPALLAGAALSVRPFANRKLGFLAAVLAAYGLFVWAFYRAFPDAPHALERFLDVTHNQQQPISYSGLYPILMYHYGSAVAVPVGVALVFAACLGIFALLYPLSVLLVHRAGGLRPIDWVPPAMTVAYLLLMIAVPVPAHGDSTELTQRPFVLLYAVVAIWTVTGFLRWLPKCGALGERRVWLPLVVLAAASVVIGLRYTVRDWRWSYTYRVAEGLPQASSFMRSHWRPGDILATQGVAPGLVVTDLAVQLVSLTGMPAYLTRPFVHISAGGRRQEVATQRYAALGGVAREASAKAALERLRELGIAWYVVADREGRGPRWDPHRKHAVFVQGAVAVYAPRAAP